MWAIRVAKTIELHARTERGLRDLSRRKRNEVRLQQHARIVMLAAKGMQKKDIAADVGLDRRQVALWRSRFLEGDIEALSKNAPRSGRPASVMAKMASRIVQATPTGPSWLKMVERFFSDITDRFTSVPELELAIDLYVAQHNIEPKPSIWTASASDILAKVTLAKAAFAAASG